MCTRCTAKMRASIKLARDTRRSLRLNEFPAHARRDMRKLATEAMDDARYWRDIIRGSHTHH